MSKSQPPAVTRLPLADNPVQGVRDSTAGPTGARPSVAAPPPEPDAIPLLDRLKACNVPWQLHFFSQIDSTSTRAALLLREKALQAPAMVVAARQTAGRGTRGRVWMSSEESVTVTFVLASTVLSAAPLPLVSGLAVRDALAEVVGEAGLGLKWPNDVLLCRRKVAGVLCERINGHDLVGVGINIRLNPRQLPPELSGRIAALHEVAPGVDRWAVLTAVAAAMAQAHFGPAPLQPAEVAARWHKHDELAGQPVSVQTPSGIVQGIGEGITPEGYLVVRDDRGGRRVIVSGTVGTATRA